jgi:hypothetical protein
VKGAHLLNGFIKYHKASSREVHSKSGQRQNQGLKQGKASGRGAPRQRAHSSKASRHKEIKNSKASREELLLYQVL